VIESEYWRQLRFRINSVKSADPEQTKLGYCDWFEVKKLTFGHSPSISGRVGFVSGKASSTTWRFTLLLPDGCNDAAHIDWTSLLPSTTSDGWLEFDAFHRLLTIDPTTHL
jgi:hypothetical protein